ncbi:MAG TPA: DUF4190 domain-containing protein [Verrucomicrobiae bacterium]|nr:DUF4190 domain-containing protein [Verrucomicrobiae bacterium]
MNAIYKIIGEDGREYGPATAEQVKQWIAEGRAERRTPIFVDGGKDWSFVGLLPEFANYFADGNPPQIMPPKPGISTAGQMAKTNPFATAGLVFGILSLTLICCCGGFPFNLLGLVFSLIALSQINRHPELYEGRSLAIAGLILSIASLALTFVLVLLNLAFHPPNAVWHFRNF